jgi:hypothetical protein
MKITVLSRLNRTIPMRIFLENNSFKRKYSETMSNRRINMKMVSFFINKRKAAKPAAVPSAFRCQGYNTGLAFHRKFGCDLDECIVSPLHRFGCLLRILNNSGVNL